MHPDDDSEQTEFRRPDEAVDEQELQPVLLILTGASAGLSIRIEDKPVILGRDPTCDLSLTDSGISRQHAQVTRSPTGEVFIEDLGSTNGTFVGSKRIDRERLVSGNRIRIGPDVLVKFELQDPLEETFHQFQFEQGLRDSLTGLYNRRHFLSRFREELATDLRERRAASFIKLSVDGLGLINEQFGFETAEVVLRRLAKLLRKSIAAEHLLCRWGEKKFAILLKDHGDPESRAAAEGIRRAIESYRLEHRGRHIPFTVSIGIATLAGDDLGEMQDLLAEADVNLHQAKSAGGNVTIASD